MFAMTQYLSLVATILGISASLFTFFNWFRSLQRRQLESERQLSHALNNFSAIQVAIAQLQESVDQLTLAVNRLEVYLNARLDGISPGSSKIRGGRQ